LKHYLEATEADYERATPLAVAIHEKATKKTSQLGAVMICSEPHRATALSEND